jgi:hypothetical protein
VKFVAILLCAGAAVGPQRRASDEPASFDVAAGILNDSQVLTIVARKTPIDVLMRAIAEELSTEVRGFDRIAVLEPVDVRLTERPSDMAIQWVLGSAGLRGILSPTGIHVFNDLKPFPDQAEVFDAAELSFIRALNRHPESPLAADGWMAQARIQESRGDWSAAINNYSMVIDNHADSQAYPQALYRAGGHFERLESWNEAATNYDLLSGLGYAHPYHVDARLKLAESLCFMGDPQKALYSLDSLETYIGDSKGDFLVQDSAKLKARRLITRSRALTLLDKSMEALRALDLASDYDIDGQLYADILEMRGLALDQGGRYNDAAIAWMSLSELLTGEEQGDALTEAARLSLAAGDELGVLFIDAHARKLGLDQDTAPYGRAARQQLGLATDDVVEDLSITLAKAEELFKADNITSAAKEFAHVYERRELLEKRDLLRLARGYSRSLAADNLLDYAVMTLREIISLCSKADDRNSIYLLAAELYEEAERFDDAIQALQGEL